MGRAPPCLAGAVRIERQDIEPKIQRFCMLLRVAVGLGPQIVFEENALTPGRAAPSRLTS